MSTSPYSALSGLQPLLTWVHVLSLGLVIYADQTRCYTLIPFLFGLAFQTFQESTAFLRVPHISAVTYRLFRVEGSVHSRGRASGTPIRCHSHLPQYRQPTLSAPKTRWDQRPRISVCRLICTGLSGDLGPCPQTSHSIPSPSIHQKPLDVFCVGQISDWEDPFRCNRRAHSKSPRAFLQSMINWSSRYTVRSTENQTLVTLYLMPRYRAHESE